MRLLGLRRRLERPPTFGPGCDRGQPGLVQLARKLSIDVGSDQGVEGTGDLRVFVLAAGCALLRQNAFVDKICKQLRIGAVSHTQQVVEALRWCSVLVGELL